MLSEGEKYGNLKINCFFVYGILKMLFVELKIELRLVNIVGLFTKFRLFRELVIFFFSL